MSYILDALRRADSDRERERGAVPGLHAQPVAPVAVPADADRRVLLGTVGAGTALAVALLIGWFVWQRADEPRAAATAPAATAPAAPIAMRAAEPAAAPTAVAPTAPPVAVASIPASASMPVGEATVAARVAVPRAPPRRQAEALPPATLPTGVPNAPQPAPRGPLAVPAARAASAEARVPTLAELPEALRRELPTLTLGGAMHSPDAGRRMLIVNGQLYREGEKIGPELWLEQIKLKDAVLRYKGTRYSVSF